MNYEIIKSYPYVERELYLIKINDKYGMFYKSSGLAGHNSKGVVIPFVFLKQNNNNIKEFGMPFGWLRKYYFIDGKETPYHSKYIEDFHPNMQPLLKQLTEDLAQTPLDTSNEPALEDTEAFTAYVRQINSEFRDIIGTNLLDVKDLI